MRILHTSDWHLGQHFMGKTREQEHQAFISWLLTTVEEQAIDAVIIAGDIFDTGTPPSYARKLYNHFVVALHNTGCQQLVIVGGNHDSVATLNESSELLACLNTHVIGGLPDNPEDQVITLTNRKGEAGAVVCAVPFVRPREVMESQAGETSEDKQLTLQEAIAGHYQVVFEKAQHTADDRLPVIATGHLTTVGGQLSESVREIYIGTLTAFPASAFPAADYIALGHLHRGQKVSGHEHIRYSGSPVPLSFDEAGSTKQVLIADFEHGQLKEVIPVEVPVFRKLASLEGSLGDIQKQLAAISEDQALSPWVEVVVATEDYLTDLQTRIEDMVSDLPFEVLRVRRKRDHATTGLTSDNRETLAELSVADVFNQRLASEQIPEDTLGELHRAFMEIVGNIEDETGTTVTTVTTGQNNKTGEAKA